jgi:hypothetical protein
MDKCFRMLFDAMMTSISDLICGELEVLSLSDGFRAPSSSQRSNEMLARYALAQNIDVILYYYPHASSEICTGISGNDCSN